MSATVTDERWWRTAPNPACVDWCGCDHAAEEFANNGGLICTRSLIKIEDMFEVVAVSNTYADGDETPAFGVEPAAVDVHVWADVLTPDQAFALSQSILAAVRLCDRTHPRHV